MNLTSPARSRFRLGLPDERLVNGRAGGHKSTRPATPAEIVVTGEHPERFEAWASPLSNAGLRLTAVSNRVDAVLSSLSDRRPAALVIDVREFTRAGYELAQQIPLRDEFVALPVLFLLPEPARFQQTPSAVGWDGGNDRSGADHTNSDRSGADRFNADRFGADRFGADRFSPERFGTAQEAHSALESILYHCQDFVFSPVEGFELAARLVRLVHDSGAQNTPPGTKAGTVEIDDRAHRVSAGGREVTLRKKEYDLLAFLIRNVGVVFTRDALLRWVWGPGFSGDARTVDVHIRRLRSKLGREAGRVIETVRRVGYRLSASAAVPGAAGP